MGVEPHYLPAGLVYEEILRRVAHTKLHGPPRQRCKADTWEPAVDAHRPGGHWVGAECQQCGRPWPCRLLLNLLNSGLVAETSP
jgi:hypothetical protein